MSALPATQRQREVLRTIGSLTSLYGYPPTVRELGVALDIKSTNGVVDHLKALEARGLIRRDGVARGTVITEAGRRELGGAA